MVLEKNPHGKNPPDPKPNPILGGFFPGRFFPGTVYIF